MRVRITGASQWIATSTTASSTALSAANLKSDWLWIQSTGAAAGEYIKYRIGPSTIAVTDDGPVIHGGLLGHFIKREELDTHIAWDASTGTPTLIVTPVNIL